MRVALLYNPKPDTVPPGTPDDAFEEYDRAATISAIARAIEALDISVEAVVADRQLAQRLGDGGFDMAFNIAEGTGRRCRAAVPAAVCELLGIPSTGSDALTLALTLDKAAARRMVSPDVPVARAVLVECPGDEAALDGLRYPAIVKPVDEGSSKGIHEDAYVETAARAAARSRWLHARYGCPALVEEYLPGAEVTVGIRGNGAQAAIIDSMEIEPAAGGEPFVYSLAIKRDWRWRVRYHVPARLTADARSALESFALTAYRLLGCRDIARLDFRLDATGTPTFIECNALPGLDPDNSDLVMLAAPVCGYSALVQGILIDAAARAGLRVPTLAGAARP
jgi:D-alanine-D-alanine ligase